MKILCIVAAFAVLEIQAVAVSKGQEVQWRLYKDKYSKRYSDHGEEMHRQQVFVENLKIIEDHNAKYDDGLVTYWLGINQFSDLTTEEFRQTLTAIKPPQNTNFTMYVPSKIAAPASVDWRSEGAVTPVKNQQQCGSCWTFSASGALEGALFKKTGNLVSISEQNLVDCAHGSGSNGCQGGFPSAAFQYVIDTGGIDSEDSYRYEGSDGECRYNSQNSVGTVSSIGQVQQGSEDDLTNSIASVGPISVLIDADDLQSYQGGVYNNPNCGTQLDHAVLAVGYGSEGGQDFYIVKNSWGESWGEQGYIRMSRNQNNQCGIANTATYPIA